MTSVYFMYHISQKGRAVEWTGRPVYTRHAREQMAYRQISEYEVETTLSEYHTRYTDPNGNPILIGEVDGRRIKVVVARGSNPPRIITTAY